MRKCSGSNGCACVLFFSLTYDLVHTAGPWGQRSMEISRAKQICLEKERF